MKKQDDCTLRSMVSSVVICHIKWTANELVVHLINSLQATLKLFFNVENLWWFQGLPCLAVDYIFSLGSVSASEPALWASSCRLLSPALLPICPFPLPHFFGSSSICHCWGCPLWQSLSQWHSFMAPYCSRFQGIGSHCSLTKRAWPLPSSVLCTSSSRPQVRPACVHCLIKSFLTLWTSLSSRGTQAPCQHQGVWQEPTLCCTNLPFSWDNLWLLHLPNISLFPSLP